jgi:hypothetical protein
MNGDDDWGTPRSERQAAPGGAASGESREAADEAEELQRIRHLPKEVGILLVVAGIGGMLLPGPVGSPFVIMGGVVLWPRVFERIEIAFARRFPRMHRTSVRQMGRFLNDMERRYPLPR